MKYTIILCCFFGATLVYGQAPVITDFSPKIGEPGESLTLTGSGFDVSSGNNIVHFGSIPATVLNVTVNSLEVEIPEGTKADKISVMNTVTNLSVETPIRFYPTFNGGARIIPASFLPHQDLTVPNAARTVRLADVDGDGWLDIIAASSQEFSIYRNLGNGGTLSSTSFSARIDIDPGSGFLDFGFADLDNDGMLDLYFSQDTNPNGKVGIYRNTSTPGSISFASEVLLNATQRISYVSAGDFDGDGRQEIIAGRAASAGGTPAYLFIYQNSSTPGSLSFSSEIDITALTPAGTWERMIVMDINGDNKLDLVALRNFKVRTSVLLNQSTLGIIDINTFAPNPDFIDGASTIALSDFDGDNLPELITHNEGNNTGIALRPNTSTAGAISFSDSIPYFSNIFREGETAIADINGDGKKDIVIAADWSQDWVSVLENNFDGTWDEESFKQPVRFLIRNIYPITLDIGDLNHDGKPDIVTANQTAFLSILENDIQFPPEITSVSAYKAQIGESITILGDHFSPVANENLVRFGSVLANVVSASTTELVVEVPQGATYDHITLGVGIFTAISPRKFSAITGPGADFDASSFAPPFSIAASADVTDLVVGDLDNDGKTDLLARDGSAPLLLKNQSTFDVLESTSFQVVTSAISHFVSPGILTDLNGDGFQDLFGTARVLFNNSEAGIEPIEFQAQITLPIFSGPSQLADLNLDGILDHVTTVNSGSVVSINEGFYTYAPFVSGGGLPNSPFGSNINLPKPAVVGTASVADFDGDGLPDIAASNPNTDNVSFFRNLGSNDVIAASGFSSALNFTVGDNPTQIVAGDLDQDGKTDLAVINQNDNTVTVLHNQSTIGNITFDVYNYSVSASPRLLRLHDLDGDSKPEIITMNAWVSSIGATFSVLKNNTASMDASSFATEQLYSRTNNAVPSDFEIADLDDDSRPDIILTSTNPDELVIYKNLSPTTASIAITAQPVNESLCEGANANFSVTATGTTNITYQWQENQGLGFADVSDGGIYSGSSTSSLILTGIANSQNGFTYRCIISGDFASDLISSEAVLNLLEQASILAQPQDQNINSGETASFSVIATGDNLSYQWRLDGTNISGETSSTLSISNVTSADAGVYSCVITSTCNTLVSNDATLTITNQTIIIDQQPLSAQVCEGLAANFNIAASGTSTITYQWQEDQGFGFQNLADGGIISGATTATLSFSSTSLSLTGFKYRCLISGDLAADIITTEAELLIIEEVNITTQPVDVTASVGEQVILSITSSGDSPTFQWFKDGSLLTNETNETITLNNVTLSDQGGYICIVENGCNSITSDEANLTIIDPNSGFSVTDGNQLIDNAQQTAIQFDPAVIGATASRSFIINNTGQTIITINEILLTGDDVFALGTTPSEVAIGGSESFEATATSQQAGIYTAVIQIETSIGNFTFPVAIEFTDVPTNGSLIVYNAVAPNGNGKHDFLKIENIESFTNNSVQIFNRWGDKVYEADGYDNQSKRFEGEGNVGSAGELVEGTYFYIIKTENEVLKGYLFLRR